MSEWSDSFGRCQCHNTGMVGEQPNTRFCECGVGKTLERTVQNWNYPVFGEVRPDKKGKIFLREESYTPESWLKLVNTMPTPGMGRAAVPASMMGLEDSLRSGTVSGGRTALVPPKQREPGDESEYD